MLIRIIVSILLFLNFSFAAQQIMTVDDLWAMKRVVGMKVDPRSGIVLLKIRTYNLEANTGITEYVAYHPDIAAPQTIFTPEDRVRDAIWYEGKLLTLIAKDQGSALSLYDLTTKSWTEIFTFPVPVYNLRASGNLIAFTASEDPAARDLDHAAELEKQRLSSPATGQIFSSLLYRHWDSWRDGKYSHLYTFDLRNKVPTRLNEGETDVPPIGLGSSHDMEISSSEQAIAFVRNPDDFPASSTNNEVYLYSHISKEIKRISTSPGNDNAPLFSPDGRYLAFLSMPRSGFEADKKKLWIYDNRDDELKEAGYDLDRSISDFVWSSDGRSIYFTADNDGYRSLYEFDMINHSAKLLIKEVFITSLAPAPGQNSLYLLNQGFDLPTELFAFDLNTGSLKQVTFFNENRLANIAFGKYESYKFIGADGDSVQGWIFYPPNFNPNKKYGLFHIIHGGPQGATGNSFHYRWNMQLFASFGFVVTSVNFHGSTGFGQAFTDRISGDWGGAPYEDIMKGTDYLLEKYNFIDSSRIVAAGASYGGFMINWIAGHTDRFKALVSHDGVFDQFSMYGATEELWFPEWDMRGIPYENMANYQKFSPSYYVQNFKTPMLVIHGEHDYRVPIGQGMQLFTALQRMGVKSKFLYFPDETHFVLSPQNAKLWWKTVYDWLIEHTAEEEEE